MELNILGILLTLVCVGSGLTLWSTRSAHSSQKFTLFVFTLTTVSWCVLIIFALNALVHALMPAVV